MKRVALFFSVAVVAVRNVPSSGFARCAGVAWLVCVVAVVAATSGCDFIRCNVDSDCPAEVPFCNAETCQATPGGERGDEGEGEGEGEGTCASDADCGAGLCYDLAEGAAHFDPAFVGTCVPGPDDDASCPEALNFNGTSTDRQTGGAVIFSATATRQAPVDCGAGESDLEVDVLYLDREGDSLFIESSLHVIEPGGSTEFASGSVSGDQTSGQGFFTVRCVSDAADHIAIAVGLSSPETNALCVPLGGAP
jgi:hypothetical protein